MSETLQIAANAVKARLLGATDATRLMITELLSYEVEQRPTRANFGGKRGGWAGRESFYDFATDSFPAGFVHQVGQSLLAQGHSVRFAIKRPPAPLGSIPGSSDPLGYGFDSRFDYQPETVRRLLRHHRMIAKIATGGGKSNIAVLAYDTIRRPTLFLTTRSALMYQMQAHFQSAGFTPGVMGDGVWAPRKGVNVAMVQSITSRLDAAHPHRDKMRALLGYFEVVIGEEAHESGGNSYYEILSHCNNAHYRLALTATPFMRADGEANMRLQAAFGSIGMQVSEKLLIDRGILATPYFKMPSPEVPKLLRRRSKWPGCYDLGVVENPERNRIIVYEAARAAKHGLPTLTLVQREAHGKTLQEALCAAGVRAAFVFGKHENEHRQEALRDLASGALQTLIGSTIFDVGVDVPSIGMLIIAGGGKAEVGHRQRIGRALRAKKRANVTFVLDFMDDKNTYLQEHAMTRQAIIRETPGFAEHLLPAGADFPYEKLLAA